MTGNKNPSAHYFLLCLSLDESFRTEAQRKVTGAQGCCLASRPSYVSSRELPARPPSKTSASKHTGSVKCLLFLPLTLLLPKNCHPPDSPEERQRSSRCPDSKELDSTPQNKEKQVCNTQGGL